jgi:hypothetical protein
LTLAGAGATWVAMKVKTDVKAGGKRSEVKDAHDRYA